MNSKLLPFCLCLLITRFSQSQGVVISSATASNVTYQEFFGKQKPWNIAQWSEVKDDLSTGNLSYIPQRPPSEGILMSGNLSLEGFEVFYGRRYQTEAGPMMVGEGSRGISLLVDPITNKNRIATFVLQVRDQTSTVYEAKFDVPFNTIEFKIYPIRVVIPFGDFLSLLDPVAAPFNPTSIDEWGIYVRGPVVEDNNSFLLIVKDISAYSY